MVRKHMMWACDVTIKLASSIVMLHSTNYKTRAGFGQNKGGVGVNPP